jgi:hypothetical protein
MVQPLLGEGLSDDYWYDVEVSNAQRRLSALSTDQWHKLSSGWTFLSMELQDRLANLLGQGGTTREAELLLQICWRADREIELTARESLREMPIHVVKIAVDCAVEREELPADTANHSSTVNGLLDFLRAEKGTRNAP